MFLYELHSDQHRDKIYNTMQKAGYTEVGAGADATVWAKDAGTVIKILMPEDGIISPAEKVFLEYYKAAQKYQDNPHFIKFVDIGGQHYTKFDIDGETFYQIAAEKLKPLKNGSFEEAVVWAMSDFVGNNVSWADAIKQIKDPNAKIWMQSYHYDFNPEKITRKLNKLDATAAAKLQYLYLTMQLIYQIGRSQGFGWDLHTENAMQRRDGTIVITDPWYSTMMNENFAQGLVEVFNTQPSGRWARPIGKYDDVDEFNFVASNGVGYQVDFLAPMVGPDELDPYTFFEPDEEISDQAYDSAKFVSFEQKSKGNKGKQGIEGTGVAAEVFGIVVNVILQYIAKAKPSMLYFQAVEPNRQRLYARMATRIAQTIQWKVKRDGSSHFAIYNPRVIKAAVATTQGVAEGGAENTEGFDRLVSLGIKLVDIPAFTKSGTSKLVTTGDNRPTVVVNINGVNMPFYQSTGGGGKLTVPVGKWYPFFGTGPSGWINKGSEKSINAFYGSSVLKTYANLLNLRIGNVLDNRTLAPMKKAGRDIINQDMLGPQDNFKTTEEANKFKNRINTILQKIGSDPFYTVVEQGVAEDR